MSLSDLASLGSFVSGIAVLASLIYLALQLRQSARNQLATIHHDRMAHIQNWAGPISVSHQAADVFVRGRNGDATLDPAECMQFLNMQFNQFLFYQEYYQMRLDGMIDGERYDQVMKLLRFIVQEPGTRAAWRAMKPLFAPKLVEFVDDIIANTPLIEGFADLSGSFKKELATERAAIAKGAT
jgi:hypothetical protein